MKNALLLTLFLLFQFSLKQLYGNELKSTYPVQVSAFLKPPYSLYLGEYCNGTKEKLIVQLLNRDLQEPELFVRLHLSIHAANGIRIETKDYNSYSSIRLSSGVPYQLTQADLCPYLQPENWNVQGVLNNGRLPEGMTEICIQAFEINTGRLLSQTSCARAWITLNQPPLLSLPAMKTEFPFRDPVNMLFQWTPRHQALSNVEYEFTLKEIWDENLSPEAAFAYSQEVYRTNTRSTSLAYTAMQPPLLENKQYAWQVRAVVRDGFEELNVFENQGYSEIYTFSISQGCNPPSDVSHQQEMEHLVIKWLPALNSQMNVVAYRGKANGGDWHLIQGNTNYANVFDLAFNTEYEYKVGTVCVDGSIVYSPIYIAILEDWRKDLEAACGVLPDIKTSNQSPLPELRVGDVFISGDFPVTVMSVTGSNGTFSGTGWIRMPLVGYSKIAVKFDKIGINTEKQMTRGFVETSYDKDEKQLADGDSFFNGGDQTGKTKTGAVTYQVKIGFTIPDGAVTTYDPDTGTIEIRDKDGNLVGTINIPEENKKDFDSGKSTTITVQDKDENVVTLTIDEDGNTTTGKTGSQQKPLANGSFSETELSSDKAIVEFYSLPNSRYAFDTWREKYKLVSLIANEKKYEHIGSYAVPCQLIPPGKTEKVGVKITILNKMVIQEDSIIFKTKMGYTVELENGVLTLNGGEENDAQDLYALYPDGKGGYWTLGKLKILSYSEPTIDLVLVPIRSEEQAYTTDIQEIRKKLEEVYGPLGITWNVTMDEPFDYFSADMNSEGSDLFSRYTDEMKALNSTYMESRGKLNKKAVYIFILRSGNIKKTDISGDMPRGKQFGYVFTSSGNLPWTIAHEVAHGKFKLQHVFDGNYGSGLADEKDNLMHYDNGTYLAKWQWDEIFDPAVFVNPFESDEDGMSVSKMIYSILEKIKVAYNERKNVSIGKFSGNSKIKIESINIDRLYIDMSFTKTNAVTFDPSNYSTLKTSDIMGRKYYAIRFEDVMEIKISEAETNAESQMKRLKEYLFVEGKNDSTKNTNLLFVNGYRMVPSNLGIELTPTNNDIAGSDVFSYWEGVDATFTERLKAKQTWYADGHHSVTTSNHRSIANFLSNIALGKMATVPNKEGFDIRASNGREAAKNLLKKLNDFNQMEDTLNIVCHSFGYAYALGIIDELTGKVPLGRFYIFAPENAGSGGAAWNQFMEVWQYGSDEKNHPINKQDGVAPQVGAQNIENGIGNKKRGRVFIPQNSSIPQGFKDSHKIENYKWVFNISEESKGYITP